MRPTFTVQLSDPATGRVAAATLGYDPDSAYTWVEPAAWTALGLRPYRTRVVAAPGGGTRTVETAVVGVSCYQFHGIDEVVRAPAAGDARLGWRTLLALTAHLDEVAAPGGAPGAAPTFTLASRPALEPFDELAARSGRLGVPVPAVAGTYQRGSLSRAGLALRYLTRRVADLDAVTPQALARELYQFLTQLLGCEEAAVLVWTVGDGRWLVEGRSAAFADFAPDDWVAGAGAGGPEVGGDATRLRWVFPTDPEAAGTEARLLCCVHAVRPAERYFLKKLFPLLGAAVDLAVGFAAKLAALNKSREDARKLLAFPRSQEDTVSYALLDQARRVVEGWTHLSFWRTSRTARRDRATARPLEKTAELNRQKRGVRKVVVEDWADVDRAGEGTHRAAPGHESVYLLAVPERAGRARGWDAARGLHRLHDHKAYRVAGGVRVGEGAGAVALDLYASHAGPPDPPWMATVRANAARLLRELPLTGAELVLVVYAYLPGARPAPDADDFRTAPDDFHLAVVVVADHAAATGVNRPALRALGRTLALRLQQYNVLSWYRYQLRQVGNFLTTLYTADDPGRLGAELQACLRSVVHTGFYLVLARPTGTVLLASGRLADWVGRALPLPELPAGDAKPYRCLTAALGADYAGLEAAVLAAVPDARLDARPVGDRAAPPKWRVGGLFAPVSDARALLVLRYGWEGWKVTSTEYSTVRLLSAALQLARPLGALGPADPVRRVEWSERLSRLLVTREDDIHKALEEFLAELRRGLDPAAAGGGEAGVSASLFAVDHDEKFVQVLVGPKEGLVLPNDPSMVTEALRRFKASPAVRFAPLVGVVADGGKSIRLIDPDFGPDRGGAAEVPFLQMVSGTPGDVMVVQGFTRINKKLPLGFVVVRLGPADGLPAAGGLAAAVERVERLADQAALILQRQIELRTSEVRAAIETPLGELRNPRRPLITRLSDLTAETQADTGHLPWALRRLFTAEYCEYLGQILEKVRGSTPVLNLSCRIRYPGADGRDKLWRLAAVGDAAFPDAYESTPGRSLHAYACDHSDGRATEPVGGLRYKRAFVPDVRRPAEIRALYPGAGYHGDDPRTVSELCYGFRIDGREPYCVSFDVEGKSFLDLWLLEEFFRQMAIQLATEVAQHYSRAEATERAGAEVGSMFIESLEHTVRRGLRSTHPAPAPAGADDPLRDFFRAAGMERLQLETDIGLNLAAANRPAGFADPSLDEVLHAGVSKFRGLTPGLEIVLETDNPTPTVRVPKVFGDVLAKLLLEQADTVGRLHEQAAGRGEPGPARPRLLVARRMTPDGRHAVVDVLNNCRPAGDRWADIACGLFWYEIDVTNRHAAGRTGKGMYLLGHMLRLIGCRPRAHPKPVPATLRTAYPPDFLRLVLAEMTGMAIELYLPAVGPGGPA